MLLHIFCKFCCTPFLPVCIQFLQGKVYWHWKEITWDYAKALLKLFFLTINIASTFCQGIEQQNKMASQSVSCTRVVRVKVKNWTMAEALARVKLSIHIMPLLFNNTHDILVQPYCTETTVLLFCLQWN